MFNVDNVFHSQSCQPYLAIDNSIQKLQVKVKAECDHLNLAHETKTNKRQCPLTSVKAQDP